MTESLSRERLETIHFERLPRRELDHFERDGWRYRIRVTLHAFSPRRAPRPLSVDVKRSRDSEAFEGSITLGRNDRRHFAELLFLLASKLKYDQLRGVSRDGAGFLHSKEIARLNDAHLTKVPKSLYASIGVLYRDSEKAGSGARGFLHRLFAYPQQMWHLVCRCGITACRANEEDLVWWLNVGPDAVVFQDVSGNPVDDGQLEKSLAKLFPKKHLLKPAEYDGFVKRLYREPSSRVDNYGETRGLSGAGEPSKGDYDEVCPCSDNTMLKPQSGPGLRYEVLEYLRDLTGECAKLPYYFPAHLRDRYSGESAFDMIRQTVRVVEHRGTVYDHLTEGRQQREQDSLDEGGLEYTHDSSTVQEENDNISNGNRLEIIPWDDQASSQFREVTILGDPGFGKSWLLRYEARQRARHEIHRLTTDAGSVDDIDVPVFVHMPSLECGENTLEKAIIAVVKRRYSAKLCDYLYRQMGLGRVVLLLDAWDEVPSLSSKWRLGDLIRNRRCRTRILLTSRFSGYYSVQPPLPEAKELELLALNGRQIRSFVRMWFDDEAKTQEFLHKLRSHRQFHELARIPLMLMLLCQACPNGRFPTRKSDLYRACVYGLLHDWQMQDKEYRYDEMQLDPVYLDRLIEALGKLAFRAHVNGTESFEASDAASALDAFLCDVYQNRPWDELAQERVNSAKLIKRFTDAGVITTTTSYGGRQLRFLHLTFQEYLAATELATRSDYIEIAMRNMYDPAWNGVLIMLGGLLRTPRLYIGRLLQKNREDMFCRPFMLAVQAAAEVGEGQLPKRVVSDLANTAVMTYLDRSLRSTLEMTAGCATCLPESLKALISRLGQRARYSGESTDVVRLIGMSKVDEAVSALIRMMQDEQGTVRKSAAEALGWTGSQEAVSILLTAMGDEKKWVRQAAADALGRIGGVEVVPVLMEAVKDSEGWVRSSAVEALGKIGGVEVVPILMEAVKDSEGYVRFSAVEALGRIGSVEVVPALMEAAKDNRERVRSSAVEALGRIGGDEVIPALMEAAKDNEERVRSSAVEALGRIGGDEVIPGLIRRITCEKSQLRDRVAAAIGAIVGKTGASVLYDWLEHGSMALREVAVRVLGGIGSEESIPCLIKAVNNEDAWICEVAVEALGKTGAKKVVPILLKAMEDHRVRIRGTAAEALGRIGAEEAVPSLMKAMKCEDACTRYMAAEALGRLRANEAVPALVEMIRDDSDLPGLMRKAGIEAVARIGSVEAIPALVEAMNCRSCNGVSKKANEALRVICIRQAVPLNINKLPVDIRGQLQCLSASLDCLVGLCGIQ